MHERHAKDGLIAAVVEACTRHASLSSQCRADASTCMPHYRPCTQAVAVSFCSSCRAHGAHSSSRRRGQPSTSTSTRASPGAHPRSQSHNHPRLAATNGWKTSWKKFLIELAYLRGYLRGYVVLYPNFHTLGPTRRRRRGAPTTRRLAAASHAPDTRPLLAAELPRGACGAGRTSRRRDQIRLRQSVL